jgi:hypothetical protein
MAYPSPPNIMPKRQKVPKDAPIFSEGNKIVGIVNYPPHDAGDNKALIAEHERFQVFPLGEIHKRGVRHIPYNSDKKDFLNKTGRDAFEGMPPSRQQRYVANHPIVFQYTYKVPGDEKEYVVVWDYNVGLVRMTPFFKSCKYTKVSIRSRTEREYALMGVDNTRQSVEGEPGAEGYHLQHHRRCSGMSRSVKPPSIRITLTDVSKATGCRI